jgi:MtrB/PioB family decaheme-associated outer membrane protein
MAPITHPAGVCSASRSGAALEKERAIRARLPVGRAAAAFVVSALVAHAAATDSAVGVDTMQGNALNRSGIDPTLERDNRGISLLAPGRSRAPDGFLYESPYEIRPASPLANNWTYRLATELGAVHSSDHAPALRDYGDYSNGFMLNYLGFAMEQTGTARYFDFTAGAVGREDQYYRANFGRYGDFRTSLYFSEIPKLFTAQARTVFLGAGSGNLTLPSGLVPGNNTPAQVAAALQATSPFELGFTRKKAGLDIDVTPRTDVRVYARYSLERKQGTRPFGGASSYPGVPAVETIEPLDYKTHDVSAGMQWSGDTVQANLGYTGSFFRNGIDTLTWEHPLTVGDPAVLQRGRIDLYPDNAFHNLKLDVSAALPLRGRVSGGLSWSRSTQDDNLIAPTVNSGMLGAVNLANWNTTDALSRQTANARIDTTLAYASAAFSPLPDLSLQARLRLYAQNNKTQYAALNPLTGQAGYFGLDGANNYDIVPGLFRVQIRSVPYDQRKDNYGVEADYRLLRRTNVTLAYDRENIKLSNREYGTTQEDRFRVALNNRDIPWATVNLAYEYAKRAGDNYNFDPYAQFYAAVALVNAPATLADLRKYDIADRRQQLVKGRVNFLLGTDMDLAVSGRYLDNDYGATYGRLGDQVAAFNVDWNWQPRPGASAYAHYGFERRRNRMAQISDDPAGYATGNPAAGGPMYPLANLWDSDSRDDAHSVGVGFRYAFARATLESGYAWQYSPYRTGYSYATNGAIVGGAAAAASAGNSMPDFMFRRQTLETSLKFALSKDTALRLYHRYERATFKDWHYDGLPLLFDNGAGVFLGAGPQDYSMNMFGVFFQYTPGQREQTSQ